MSGPQPPIALEGHCSAIHDNTLYVLSPAGLQSLPLERNATWTQEASGQAVTGPACVTAAPGGDQSQAALYVIGGASDNDEYGGLQRYTFSNKSWETLSLPTDNMKDRTNHSAAFLEDDGSILVYAGSQPDAPSLMSSQTFTITIGSSHNIQAFVSKAPPTNLPILEPWNSSHAVLAGGSPYNTEVFLFEPSQGWSPLGTNLTKAVDQASRGTIIDGSDGSKVLELYDFNVSPNLVSQIVLLGANGETAETGQTIESSSSSRKRKRDLTLNNWPAYNSTNAPTATRTDCAVVQGPSGIAAMSGGSSDLPVALFDQSGNSWVDVEQFFNSKDQQPLKPSSTIAPSSSGTATSSSTPSSTKAAGGSGNGLTPHQKMLKTLGITLGVLCGIAAIFILILLYLRWRRTKNKRKEGYIDEKTGNRLSFADRGASFMKEAGGSVNNLLPPGNKQYSNLDNGSHSSMAIMAGKFGGNKHYTANHQPKASSESTAHLVKDKSGTPLIPEPVEMLDIGDKKLAVPSRKPLPRIEHPPPALLSYDTEKELAVDDRDRKRSSGWSKYFATSGPTGPNGISHLPAAYIKNQPVSGSGMSDGSQSQYSSLMPSHPSRIPSSVLVPPLDIDFTRTFDGQRLSHVASGSPSFNDSREDLARRGSTAEFVEGHQGLIVESPGHDRRSQISGYSLSSTKRTTMGSTLSSNVTSEYYNESGNTPWSQTPVSFKDHINDSRPTSDNRPTSSNYTNSVYEPRVPSRGKNGGGFFPGSGTSYKPTNKPSRLGSAADLPPPPKPPGLTITKPAEERDSTITVFPRGVPSAYYAGREQAKAGEQKSMASDMSWLNLGLGGHQNKI
ncbi:hypothetical protein LTR56_020048 [Elasticomyces elasticus]|nr:hypothetical protein LTR56_020048 [Elasticomyces elasticus]KAK3636206.1 hypothetical protein LTR22_018810 [Elasticomyces elasticus]KAK4918366.1 hypothetical protein LTR49_013917 [Elasticomyces elasticus]KAK5762685.1 hypothetical protein LTS12_007073 [Elasticomyces elasticus]